MIYQPLFKRLPESAEERFELVERYARTWCDQTIKPPRGEYSRELATAEAGLGQPLPAALREFYTSGLYDWYVAYAGTREWTPPR